MTATCATLDAQNPWENCSISGCEESNYPLNGIFCAFADENNASPSIAGECGNSAHRSYHWVHDSTNNGACHADWTCTPCPSGQLHYNLGKPPGDSQSQENCCTPDDPRVTCAGHAGNPTSLPNNCGYLVDCSAVTCDSTSCPTGCCQSGVVCRPGTGQTLCGNSGATCANCGTAPCLSGSQTCGTGCTGCWFGDTCFAGNTNSDCGQDGIDCDFCSPPDTTCKTGPAPNHIRGCWP